MFLLCQRWVYFFNGHNTGRSPDFQLLIPGSMFFYTCFIYFFVVGFCNAKHRFVLFGQGTLHRKHQPGHDGHGPERLPQQHHAEGNYLLVYTYHITSACARVCKFRLVQLPWTWRPQAVFTIGLPKKKLFAVHGHEKIVVAVLLAISVGHTLTWDFFRWYTERDFAPSPPVWAGWVVSEGGQSYHPREGIRKLRFRGVPLRWGDHVAAEPERHPVPGPGVWYWYHNRRLRGNPIAAPIYIYFFLRLDRCIARLRIVI